MDKDLSGIPEIVLLKNAISGIPLKYGDHVVGTADLMPNGSIRAHIDWAEIPKELHRFFSHGLAGSLSIAPEFIPAEPTTSLMKTEPLPSGLHDRVMQKLQQEENVADEKIPLSNAQPGLYISRAIELVYQYVKDHLEKTDTHVTFGIDEVFVVWFCKTLQNWKALVSTTLPDGMYYEVTYDGDKKRTYIDAYKKFDNQMILDDPAQLPKLSGVLEVNTEDLNATKESFLKHYAPPAGDDRFA